MRCPACARQVPALRRSATATLASLCSQDAVQEHSALGVMCYFACTLRHSVNRSLTRDCPCAVLSPFSRQDRLLALPLCVWQVLQGLPAHQVRDKVCADCSTISESSHGGNSLHAAARYSLL